MKGFETMVNTLILLGFPPFPLVFFFFPILGKEVSQIWKGQCAFQIFVNVFSEDFGSEPANFVLKFGILLLLFCHYGV